MIRSSSEVLHRVTVLGQSQSMRRRGCAELISRLEAGSRQGKCELFRSCQMGSELPTPRYGVATDRHNRTAYRNRPNREETECQSAPCSQIVPTAFS